MKCWIVALSWVCAVQVSAQTDTAYQQFRSEWVARFKNTSPGKFVSFGEGVKVRLGTDQKIMALTFDACGGRRPGGYDEELIQFLRREKIPATLFLTGLWIDEHPDLAKQLAGDTLFEIENHGLTHRPCSVTGASRYGIQGTQNVGQVVDEIELNARKIEHLTHRRPVFFRAATATSDEACGRIAQALGESIVNFDILSGDAVAGTSALLIEDNLVKNAHGGAIVIMHMNHPEWNGYEALREALPQLRKKGYSFVKLADHTLKGRH